MKRYPYTGKMQITAVFGQTGRQWSHPHYGLDMVGQSDKTIYAVDGGTVLTKNAHGSAYGNHIDIGHPDGTTTLYAHLSQVFVSPGEVVALGQAIGKEGATGNVTGPHLHFEAHSAEKFRFGEDLLNPASYLSISSKENSVDSIVGPWQGVTTAGQQNIVVEDPDRPQFKIAGAGESGAILFGRRYRVFVDLGGRKSLEVSSLRCTFQIIKTILLEPNLSVVTIYNLSPQTEGTIIKEGQKVVIEAGYEGDQYGVIFDGNVVQPVRGKEEGTTYTLTLVCMDGDRYVNGGFVGVSLVAGQSQRDVVNACLSRATNPIEAGSISEGLAKTKLPRGKVLFGLGANYMRQLAQSSNSTFYIADGKANIISPADVPQGQIFDLSAESGLVDVPYQTEYGVNARMLLNPRVNVNSLIRIDNRLIRGAKMRLGQPVRPLDEDGIYRVYKLTHIGDTRGPDGWYTEVETVSQAGALPGMLAGALMNPW